VKEFKCPSCGGTEIYYEWARRMAHKVVGIDESKKDQGRVPFIIIKDEDVADGDGWDNGEAPSRFSCSTCGHRWFANDAAVTAGKRGWH